MTVSFAQMTLQGGAFILLAALLRAAALERLPKGLFVGLWTLALARLLAPLGLPVLPVAAPGLPPPGGGPAGEGSPLLPALWLTVAAGMGAYFLLSHLRARRALRRAEPLADPDTAAWLRGQGLRRRVELRTLPGLGTPVTYGLLRPVIVLPPGTDPRDPDVRLALLHELAHIRRFHTALKGLAALALCLHWFNPAVWLLYTLLGRDIELACDEAVLRTLDADARRAYALALLRFRARRDGLTPRMLTFGRHPAEERIKCIMRFKKKSPFLQVLALAVLAAATVAAFAARALPDKTPEPPEEPEPSETVEPPAPAETPEIMQLPEMPPEPENLPVIVKPRPEDVELQNNQKIIVFRTQDGTTWRAVELEVN